MADDIEEEKIGSYTLDELASLIDNEGFDYFFTSYTSPSDFEGTPIADEVAAFIEARENLLDKLYELGLSLDE